MKASLRKSYENIISTGLENPGVLGPCNFVDCEPSFTYDALLMNVLFAHLISLSKHFVTKCCETPTWDLSEVVLEIKVLALDLWNFCELSPEQIHLVAML
jgi:hypothetical protein